MKREKSTTISMKKLRRKKSPMFIIEEVIQIKRRLMSYYAKQGTQARTVVTLLPKISLHKKELWSKSMSS